MSNANVAAALALLAPLADAWLAALKAAYRAQADRNAAAQPEVAKSWQPSWGHPSFRPLPFVTVDDGGHGSLGFREKDAVRNACIAGKVAPNHEAAERAAQAELEAAKAAFAARLAEKLAVVFGRDAEPSLSASLRLAQGVVDGTITARALDCEVVFDAAGKTNYRYGENSANRSMTQYAQYPFRVVSCVVRGAAMSGDSAEFVGYLVRGVDPVKQAAQEKAAAKAAKEAKRAELERLDRVKGAYNDVARVWGAIDLYGKGNPEYKGRLEAEKAALEAKHGLEVTADKRQALLAAKRTLAQIRQIKGA